MSLEIINPTDEQHWLECRTKDITSTEISALFGFSPYMTEFELWHRKREGTVVKLEENERMEWGNALQDAIAAKIAKKNGWLIRRVTEYIRQPGYNLGASFDFEITFPDGTKALLEIKNVDSLQFKNGWKEDEDGNIEAPLHIEIQVQQQLLVSELKTCYIGALVGGNRLELIKREYNDRVAVQILKKAAAFWMSIEKNEAPQPNFVKDAEFISKLYGFADPGKFIDVTDNETFINLAREHKRLGDIMRDADAQRDALKAQMLMVIGDAEKVEGGEFSISAGMIASGHVAYDRKPYRNFKPSWRKQK